MKLAGREAAAFLARPDPGIAGVLLFGADPMRVALRREALIEALIGPDGASEMRLTRIAGGDLRRDPAALGDALRATGFFPGPRAVLVEGATDAAAPLAAAALEDWHEGDAVLVVTAGSLTPRGALRKSFEAAKNAAAIAVYSDPPGRAELAEILSRAGLGVLPDAAMAEIETLAGTIEPGEIARFAERLALYKLEDDTPVSPEDVAACAPRLPEADLDALVALVADGAAARLAGELRRVGARSGAATSLTIAAGRHFRALHAAASAEDGPEAALSRLRPPVFGPRRTRMASQARAFGRERLEMALGLITEADLLLRSGRPVPGLALVERLFVRVAMLRGR